MSDALKWFSTLHLPEQWAQEVSEALDNFESDAESSTPMHDLIKALSACEALADAYRQKGIDEKILKDTLSDLVIWANNHNLVTGEVGLSEALWLASHLEMKLFRLGRLQFRFGKAQQENQRLGLRDGEAIIEVHIPQGEPLEAAQCSEAFLHAIDFFEKYFPEYEYRYFTCDSWLLDFNLKDFFDHESNILKFQANFDVISYKESQQAMRYLFELNRDKNTENSLQKKVRLHTENGGKLFAGYGVIDKESIRSKRAPL